MSYHIFDISKRVGVNKCELHVSFHTVKVDWGEKMDVFSIHVCKPDVMDGKGVLRLEGLNDQGVDCCIFIGNNDVHSGMIGHHIIPGHGNQ